MANKNRQKGHNAERHYAQIFKTIFPECQTSRYASRQLDDAKVDLAHLPFLIQIKAGIQKGLKPDSILEEMKEQVPSMYKDFIKAVIHHKQGTPGRRRTPYDSIVTMTFDDFFTLIKMAYDSSKE